MDHEMAESVVQWPEQHLVLDPVAPVEDDVEAWAWKIEPVVGEWEADAIGHSHDHFVRHLPVVQAQPLRLVPLGLGPWHAWALLGDWSYGTLLALGRRGLLRCLAKADLNTKWLDT